MIIKKRDGTKIQYEPISPRKVSELSRLISQCMSSKPHVLVTMVGNKGVGKSTLGKYFRNYGIGEFGPRDIAVIDDDNMAVDFLFFFRRWYANPCRGVDELKPFVKHCGKKTVRIYIKSNPESRITQTDILLQLSMDEAVRKERLIERYGSPKGEQVAVQTQQYETEPRIKYTHIIEATIG